MATGMQWYVVHTFTGHENRVKSAIERRAKAQNLLDRMGRILVLIEEEVRGTRRGKKQVRKHKVFPGYVIIEMILDQDTHHLIRSTSGVTGFVGPGRQPVALSPDEVKRILGTLEEDTRVRAAFEEGQTVRIFSGPFEGFHARVEQVDVTKQKLRALISIFGRDTPVEVGFSDVEKMD